MSIEYKEPTHKATTIIVVYDDGCVEQCPVAELDVEYRDLVVEDVAQYVNVQNNISEVNMIIGGLG